MHPWNVTVEEAIALQKQLRSLVQPTRSFELDQITTVAGVDAAYAGQPRAAVVVFSYPDLRRLDQAVATRDEAFPYIPGLLSFREVPVVLDALANLRIRPDLLIADGQGYAHPRRFGLASHLGVFIDLPTIGCAKSRLIGHFEEPGPAPGDTSPLLDRGETIGAVVRTKARTRPLFVSIGHKIDLETAVKIVLSCVRGYRLPEPTRAADQLSRLHEPTGARDAEDTAP
jgi:deoxyribonuclease V